MIAVFESIDWRSYQSRPHKNIFHYANRPYSDYHALVSNSHFCSQEGDDDFHACANQYRSHTAIYSIYRLNILRSFQISTSFFPSEFWSIDRQTLRQTTAYCAPSRSELITNIENLLVQNPISTKLHCALPNCTSVHCEPWLACSLSTKKILYYASVPLCTFSQT